MKKIIKTRTLFANKLLQNKVLKSSFLTFGKSFAVKNLKQSPQKLLERSSLNVSSLRFFSVDKGDDKDEKDGIKEREKIEEKEEGVVDGKIIEEKIVEKGEEAREEKKQEEEKEKEEKEEGVPVKPPPVPPRKKDVFGEEEEKIPVVRALKYQAREPTPSSVLVFPLYEKPVFPGTVTTCYIQDKAFIKTLVERFHRKEKYVGLFYVKEEAKEESSMPNITSTNQLHQIGVLGFIADISAAAGSQFAQVIISGVRRIQITGTADSEARLTAKIEEVEDYPYDRSNPIIRAYTQEILKAMKEISELDPYYKVNSHSQITFFLKLTLFFLKLKRNTCTLLQSTLTLQIQQNWPT